MSDRRLPRVVLAQPSQSGWILQFDPQSAAPHAVADITVSLEHQLLEMDGASTFPRVTLEPGAPPRGKLTVALRLKEGVTAPTDIVEGMLTIHYIDASNSQEYWQPWRCRAGAKSDKGPYFELDRPGRIEAISADWWTATPSGAIPDGFAMPEDDDDWAELRLQAVRVIYRGRPDATTEQRAAGYYMLRGSEVERLLGGERLMYGQLGILQEGGVLVYGGWRLGSTDTMCAELTSEGVLWALRGDGREHQRRRRRILRWMLAQPNGPSRMFDVTTIACALELDRTTVGIDLTLLSDADCVHAISVDQEPHPVKAGLKAKGIRVAQEGWTQVDHMRSGNQINTYNVQGSGHRIATSLSGKIEQNVARDDQAELRQVVGQLTEAIRGLDRSVKDRAVALTIAQQVAAAVDAPDRDPDELADHWTWLGRYADSVSALGALGAPASIPALYEKAAPLIAPLLQLSGGG